MNLTAIGFVLIGVALLMGEIEVAGVVALVVGAVELVR